jgi:hypothetical protein
MWHPAVGEIVKVRRWRRLPRVRGKVAALEATVGVEQAYTVRFMVGGQGRFGRSELKKV